MSETICETSVDAYKRNWMTSRDGNVSIRHHDRDYFYITPSGVRKQTLQPDQFKKIKLLASSWEKLEYKDISRSLKPGGEIPLHYGLQKKMGQHSNEVRVAVHLHPTFCIATVHAGIDSSKISESFPELNRYTRVAPNVLDVEPISQQLADQCHANLKLDDESFMGCDIVGFKGHGVVTIDVTPWRAFEHIERLEHI